MLDLIFAIWLIVYILIWLTDIVILVWSMLVNTNITKLHFKFIQNNIMKKFDRLKFRVHIIRALKDDEE